MLAATNKGEDEPEKKRPKFSKTMGGQKPKVGLSFDDEDA